MIQCTCHNWWLDTLVTAVGDIVGLGPWTHLMGGTIIFTLLVDTSPWGVAMHGCGLVLRFRIYGWYYWVKGKEHSGAYAVARRGVSAH
jgi:hypothetical protein